MLERKSDVRLAVLFGSAARDAMRADSDVDIGVRLEEGSESLSAMNVELERALGRRVDLVSLDQAPPLLRFEIARQGTVLIERRTGDWAHFRARAMVDWWDWAPTARMMHRITALRLKEDASGST